MNLLFVILLFYFLYVFTTQSNLLFFAFQTVVNVEKEEESEPKVEPEEPSTTGIPKTNGTYSIRSKTSIIVAFHC
jgi:hypothetical protein